jgi:hypothetical protein
MGDFNLICNDSDKSLGNLDRTMMHRFRKALNHMDVKEIQLTGRKFTGTNRHNNPIMSRIDRAYCFVPWEQWYQKPILQALSSSSSDHCPLLLVPLETLAFKPCFRLETSGGDFL